MEYTEKTMIKLILEAETHWQPNPNVRQDRRDLVRRGRNRIQRPQERGDTKIAERKSFYRG